MKIYTENAEEYIAVRLAIVGEIEQESLLEEAPFAKSSVYRAVKDLRSKKVLIKHRYEDGRTFLRLSSLSGEYLSCLSPALLANAKQLVRPDLKYSGSLQVRARDRANYEFYGACLDMGIPVNEFATEYRAKSLFESVSEDPKTEGIGIYKDSGAPYPFEEIAELIDARYTGLFTKKLIKQRENGELTNQGKRNARITGTLIVKGQIYQTYALLDPCSSAWIAEAEFTASNYIQGCIQRMSPYYRDKGIILENKCILAFSGPEYAKSMILATDDRPLRIDPCRIYMTSYVSPSYKLSEPLMKLLAIPDWRRYMASALFPGGNRVGIADVIAEDGSEVYNFIGCDLNRIRYTAPRIQQADCHIVILAEPWMSDALSYVFNRQNVEIIEINSEEQAILADGIL